MKKLLKFFVELFSKIKRLFNALPDELKEAVRLAVIVTDNIKNFIDSPAADLLTAIIPGNADNIIVAKLRNALPVFLVALRLADEADLKNPDAILRTAAQSLKELDPVIKSGVLHNLSALCAQAAADGKLSWSDAVYLAEWVYQQNKINK